MFAFEPLYHELIFLARRKPGPHRLPGPARPDPTVFGLSDADQALLRGSVQRMVVYLIAPLKLPGDGVLARQGVGLVHRHGPVPGKGLLRSVPEIGLIARVYRNGPAVRTRLMPLYRLRGGHIGRML